MADSEAFFQRPDGRLRRVLSRVGRPIDSLLKAAPQGFQNAVGSTLHGVLSTVATSAEVGQYQTELVDLICARSGQELEPWNRIFTVDLAVLETLVKERLRSAKAMATVQGGVTGVGGAPGLLADIPTRYDDFSPRNYDEQYSGAVPASEALALLLSLELKGCIVQLPGKRFKLRESSCRVR